MEPMMKVINALVTLTVALQELTEQTTTDYLDTFEEIGVPEKGESKKNAEDKSDSEVKTVTFVELRSRLAEISRAGHTTEVRELLQKFGAGKLSDIAESDYSKVLKEAEEL